MDARFPIMLSHRPEERRGPCRNPGQKRIGEGSINHRRGEPQGLPPALEGHKRLNGPGGGEKKAGEQAENDGLMPALFFLLFQKPRCRHASEAAPEPKLSEESGELMSCANNIPMQQGRFGRQRQKDQPGRKHCEHEQQPFESRAFRRRARCVVRSVFLVWRRCKRLVCLVHSASPQT